MGKHGLKCPICMEVNKVEHEQYLELKNKAKKPYSHRCQNCRFNVDMDAWIEIVDGESGMPIRFSEDGE